MRKAWCVMGSVAAAGLVFAATWTQAGDLNPPDGAIKPSMATLGEIAASVAASGSVSASTGTDMVVSGAPRLPIAMVVRGEGGIILGEDTIDGQDGVIELYGFQHEILSPRDAVSGLPTGKRQHKPLVISKQIDKASPLLMQALVNSENLPSVVLRFYRANRQTGNSELYYTVELVNVRLVDVSSYTVSVVPGRLEHREHVSFVYQKIIWTYVDGGVTAEDDWQTSV